MKRIIYFLVLSITAFSIFLLFPTTASASCSLGSYPLDKSWVSPQTNGYIKSVVFDFCSDNPANGGFTASRVAIKTSGQNLKWDVIESLSINRDHAIDIRYFSNAEVTFDMVVIQGGRLRVTTKVNFTPQSGLQDFERTDYLIDSSNMLDLPPVIVSQNWPRLSGGGQLYAINPLTKEVYHYRQGVWTNIGPPASMFVVDTRGILYSLSPNKDSVWRWNGTVGNWTHIGELASRIYTVGNVLFAVGPDGSTLYRYDGIPFSWSFFQ